MFDNKRPENNKCSNMDNYLQLRYEKNPSKIRYLNSLESDNEDPKNLDYLSDWHNYDYSL